MGAPIHSDYQPPPPCRQRSSITMQSFARIARPLASAIPARSLHVAAARRPAVLLGASKASAQFQQMRFASGGSLSKDAITSRVMEVLKSFEKVNAGQLQETASFTSDLGLDSLDAVEVVMAIEEEFAIEIPDEEADQITTVGQAIDYISKTPEGECQRSLPPEHGQGILHVWTCSSLTHFL